MRLAVSIFVVALAGCVPSVEQQASRQAEAERDLAGFLGDRVAGTPQDCISMTTNFGGPTIIDSRRIGYQVGGRVYLNELPAECRSLRPMDTLIVEMNGGQLCRNDRFRAVQPGTSIPGAYCLFGRFTPYEKR